MGMFDTVILKEPYKCDCGELIKSFQVKCFENLLEYYKEGDFVPSTVYSGIIKDELYCNNKSCGKQYDCFMVIKNSILFGVYYDLETAEKENQLPMDRLYLQERYFEYFKNYNELKRKYNSLVREIDLFHEYRNKLKENPDYKPVNFEKIHFDRFINLSDQEFLKKYWMNIKAFIIKRKKNRINSMVNHAVVYMTGSYFEEIN